MQLTVNETARLLHVSEKAVQNWIRTRGLPACKINDQYRLNRVDLLEWATEHGLQLSPDIFATTQDVVLPFPSLSQALEAGGIHYGVEGDDVLAVLGHIVPLLNLPPHINHDFLLQVLLAREALGTTSVGNGIAIPHVRNPILLQVGTPTITLCFLQKGIDFKAQDGKLVNVLFTLISPTARIHLHLLAKLAYALCDARFRTILENQSTPSDIMAVTKTLETEQGAA